MVIDRLVARIEAVRPEGIARVAIDGPDAAGKTTLAATLAGRLAREVVAVSVDGFHHPPEVRGRRGPLSPEGFYEDAIDHAAVRRLLLEPLAPGGDRRYRRATYDHRTSTVEDAPVELAAETAVLLVDGVFLQRPELREHWDLSIYLHVGPEETLRRAMTRDVELFGDALRERYLPRYLPGQALYRERADPVARADIVIDNTDPERPRILRDWRPRRPAGSGC